MSSASAAVLPQVEPPRSVDDENPWPGLEAFNERAATYFQGRDGESDELARLTAFADLTVLFGKSGLGKTSLLQAGLFPRLRKRGIFPVYVRLAVQERGPALIEQLTQALEAEAELCGVQITPEAFTGTLWERLHKRDFALWAASTRPLMPLFVLDQFEEVFTLGATNGEAIERLRVDLADLIENRIPASVVKTLESSDAAAATFDVRKQRYKVLLSFREDFLPDVESWSSGIPSLMRNRFRLTAMTAEQAYDVVYKNGSRASLVDEANARAIVRFVGKIHTPNDARELGPHEIEPALLSLVCSELNKRRPPNRPIDAELLRHTGTSIIADFYLRQVATVPDATRRFIEKELVTEGGYRDSFPLDDALEHGVLTKDILGQLVDGRVLRIEQQLGTPRVELTHDRLTDVVRSERDKRRARDRSVNLRRRVWLYGMVALASLALILFATFSYLKRQVSEAQRKQLQEERDRANAARDEATQALTDLRLQQEKTAIQESRVVALKQEISAVLTTRDEAVLAGLKPEAAAKAEALISRARAAGIDARLIVGYRTPAQDQARAAQNPRLARRSTHQTGLAFDIGIFNNGKHVSGGNGYRTLGKMGTDLGLKWGGAVNLDHFEMPDALAVLRRSTANP